MKPVIGLLLFLSCVSSAVLASQRPAANSQGQQQSTPAGTERGTPTTERDATPKFNMEYFAGEWTFESSVSETPLGPGGPVSGTETVRNVWDGRFWDITVKGEGPSGPFSGKGVLIYQDGFAGQAYTRYEVTGGIALLKTGTLGCDLGGACSMYFETPPFEQKGATIRLRGRYYLTSPFSYRVTTEISVDKTEFKNLGTMLYTKDQKARPSAIK